jgi:hypothetical protein
MERHTRLTDSASYGDRNHTKESEVTTSANRIILVEAAVGTATRALTERPLGSEELVEDEMGESDEEEEV